MNTDQVQVNVNIGNVSIGQSNGTYGYPSDKQTFVVRAPYEAFGPYGFRITGGSNFKGNTYFTHPGMLADAMENYTTVVTQPGLDSIVLAIYGRNQYMTNMMTYMSASQMRTATGIISSSSYGSLGRYILACAAACIQRQPVASVGALFPNLISDEMAINTALSSAILSAMKDSNNMYQKIRDTLLSLDSSPYDAIDTVNIGIFRPGNTDTPVEMRLSVDIQLTIPVSQRPRTITLTGISIVLLMTGNLPYRVNQICADDTCLGIISDYGNLLMMGDYQSQGYIVPSTAYHNGFPLSVSDITSVSRGNGNLLGLIDCSGQAYSYQKASPFAAVNLTTTSASSLYGRYVVDCVSGTNHMLCLDSTGFLHGIGANASLGIGNTSGTTSSLTVAISPGKRFASVSAGGNFSVAADASGVIWVWGQATGAGSAIASPQVLSASFAPRVSTVDTNGSLIACIDVSGILYTCTYPGSNSPLQYVSGSITSAGRFSTVACSSSAMVAIDTGGGVHAQGTFSASSLVFVVPTRISSGTLGLCTAVRACVSNYGVFVQDSMGRVHTLHVTKGDGNVNILACVAPQIVYSPGILRYLMSNDIFQGIPFRLPFPGSYTDVTAADLSVDMTGPNSVARSVMTPGLLMTTTASGTTIMAMTVKGKLYQLSTANNYGTIRDVWNSQPYMPGQSFHASYHRDIYCEYSSVMFMMFNIRISMPGQFRTYTLQDFIGSTSIYALETVVYNDAIVFIRASNNTLYFIPLVNITTTSTSPSMAATGMLNYNTDISALTTMWTHDVQVSFKALRAGYNCMYAISTDNDLYMWADASLVNLGVFPRTPSNTSTTRRENFSTGTLVANNIIDVAGAFAATAIVTKDRRVYLWGSQENVSGTSTFASPYLVNSGSLVTSISDNLAVRIVATEDTFAVLDVKGRVHTWGGNKYGQFGTQAKSGTLVPFILNDTYGPLYGKTVMDIGSTKTLLLVLDDRYDLYALGTRYTPFAQIALLEPTYIGNIGYNPSSGFQPTPTPIPKAFWTVTPTPVPAVVPTVAVNQWSILDINPDNTNWPSDEIVAIAWAPRLTRFVAITSGYNILTSSDGTTWKVRSSTASMSGIAWSDTLGIFVAVSFSSAYAYYSHDGVQWYTNNDYLYGISCVAWADTLGIFVALPSGSTNSFWSTNGIRWYTIENAVPASDWNTISWSSSLGIFVALTRSAVSNNQVYSTNGLTWTNINSGNLMGQGYQSIAWSPFLGMFVGVGGIASASSPIIYSTTGTWWDYASNNPISNMGYRSVTWSSEAGCFYAVANTITSGQPFLITSTNGKSWSTVTSIVATATMSKLNAISWAPALCRFVVMGSPLKLVATMVSEQPPVMSSDVFAVTDNDISERAMIISYYNDIYDTTTSSLIAMGAKAVWTSDYNGQRYAGSRRISFSVKYTNSTGSNVSATLLFSKLGNPQVVATTIIVNGLRAYDVTDTVNFPPGFNTAIVIVDANQTLQDVYQGVRFAFISNGVPIAVSDENTRADTYLNQNSSADLYGNGYDSLLADMIAWHDGDSYMTSVGNNWYWFNRTSISLYSYLPMVTGYYTRTPYYVGTRRGFPRIALVADTNISAVFSSILFSLTDYTVMMVARYTGTTGRQRILGASGISGASNLQYIAGFHNGRAGVAYHGDSGTNGSGWIANGTNGGTDLHGNDFCIIVDTPSRFRTNMVDRTIKNSSYIPSSMQWRLNNMPNNENSNFAIAAIMFFRRTLHLHEIQIMENLLYKMYMDVSPLMDFDARTIQQLPDTEVTTWLNNSPRKTIISASGLANVTGAPRPMLRHSSLAITSDDTTFSRYVEFNRSWQQYFRIPNVPLEAFKGLTIFAVVGFSAASHGQAERVFDFGNGAATDNLFFGRDASGATRLSFNKMRGVVGSPINIDSGVPDSNMHLYTLVLQGTSDASNNLRIFRDAEKAPLVNTVVSASGQTRTHAVTLLINYIGRSNSTADVYFQGRIGLLRVHDQVLPDDIIDEYRWDIAAQIPGNSLVTSNINAQIITSAPMIPGKSLVTSIAKRRTIKPSIVNRFGYHTLATDNTGDVYAWGLNDSGQIGNNTSGTIQLTPVLISTGSLANKVIAQVAASRSTSIALDSAGILHAWGSNASGQYGNGTTTSSLIPVLVQPTGSIASAAITYVSMGATSTHVLDTVGRVHSWGSNEFGQLGNSTIVSSNVPVSASGLLSSIVALRAGERHVVAADASGIIYAWGDNSFGQCCGAESVSMYTSPIVITMSGAQIVATRVDLEKILFDTRTQIRQLIASATLSISNYSLSGLRLARLETGSFHTIVVYYSGTGSSGYNLVYGFGYNEYGQVCADFRSLAVRKPSPCFYFNTLELVQSCDPVGLSVGSFHNVIYTISDVTKNIYNTSTNTKVRAFWGRSDGYSFSNSTAATNTQFAYMYTDDTNPVTRSGSSLFYPGNFSTDVPPTVVEMFAGTDTTFAVSHNGTIFAWGPGTRGAAGYMLQPHWNMVPTPLRFGNASMCQVVPRIYRVDISAPRSTHVVQFLYGSIVVPLEISLVQSTQVVQIRMPESDANNTLSLLSNTIMFPDLGLSPSGLGTFYVGMYPGCIQVYSTSTMIEGSVMSPSILPGTDVSQKVYFLNTLGIKSAGTVFDKTKAYNYIQSGYVDASGTIGTTVALVSTCVAPVAPTLATSLAYTAQDMLSLAENGDSSVSLKFIVSNTGKVYGYGTNTTSSISTVLANNANVTLPVSISSRGSLQSATIRRIVSGLGHVLALDSLGRIHGWGNNASSQVTDNRTPGFSSSVGTPIMISTTGSLLTSTASVVQVAAGDSSSFALDASGRLHVWGSNTSNAIGLSLYTQMNSPFLNNTGSLASATLSQINARGTFFMALDTTGRVHTFGTLGTIVQSQPTLLTYGSFSNGTIAGVTISRVIVGNDNLVAITSTGAVYGGGGNTKSRILGNGTASTSVTAQVLSWQGSLTGKTIAHVALGLNSTMAIDASGRAHAWGDYMDGVSSLVPIDISASDLLAGKTMSRVYIAGKTHMLVDTTGEVYTWSSLLVYPPVALTAGDTIISNQSYGNGLYQARASSQDSTTRPAFGAFDKNWTGATTFSVGLWSSYNVGTYNGTGAYIGSANTTVSGVVYLGEWLQIMMPQQVTIGRIVIYPHSDWSTGRLPKNFVFAGSNDGTNFTQLLSVSGYTSWASNIGSQFNFVNRTAYNYYRVCIGATGGERASIGELLLYAGMPQSLGVLS